MKKALKFLVFASVIVSCSPQYMGERARGRCGVWQPVKFEHGKKWTRGLTDRRQGGQW